MFRATQDPSSGSLVQCLDKITRMILSCPLTWTRALYRQHIVTVIRWNKGVLVKLILVKFINLGWEFVFFFCVLICVVWACLAKVSSFLFSFWYRMSNFWLFYLITVRICWHNSDLVHVNGHDRIILVILAKYCTRLPDDGSCVIRNMLEHF